MQYLRGTAVKSTIGTPNPHRHTTRAWHTIGADLFTLDRALRSYSLTTRTGGELKRNKADIRVAHQDSEAVEPDRDE